jgi:hypothetical protein
LTGVSLDKDEAETKKITSVEAIEEESQETEKKVTSIANDMPEKGEL